MKKIIIKDSYNSKQNNDNLNNLQSGEIDLKNLQHEENIDIKESNNNQENLNENNGEEYFNENNGEEYKGWRYDKEDKIVNPNQIYDDDEVFIQAYTNIVKKRIGDEN